MEDILNILLLFVVFGPLFAAFIVGMACTRIPVCIANIITCGFTIFSAFGAGYIFHYVVNMKMVLHITLYPWIQSGSLIANWAIYVDVLTAVMLVVITSVSALVHVYSVGYMSHDPHRPRFMAYLSLFTFCMLMLVTADNFMQLFFGWEGVGLSSYLLIGFWFKRKSANAAAIKAFLVNRVGDFGFLIGIFMIFLLCNSVQFADVFSYVKASFAESDMDQSYINVACFFLFIGCMGKSAQLGLHTWLPDAMEGPTPVSALIHAATMVTAGVFMLARCSYIFEYAECTLRIITIVGAVTCVFAASVALVQNDIKKIIAYSTCSQLGYMFFACGVSAYAAAIFHLMTHAFFKALLFLGAGSVIHAMSDEQDIRNMGGLYRLIPYTYAMMWIGSLALAGIYPFGGFFSKDVILEAAYASGDMGKVAYYLGIFAAFCTAFYSWRLLIMTFHGKANASKKVMEHVHESPLTMALPLFVLALGSVMAGMYGMYVGMVENSLEFWNGSLFMREGRDVFEKAHHVESWVAFLPLIVGVGGIITAYVIYYNRKYPVKLLGALVPVHKLLANKYYFDEIYSALLVKPLKSLGSFLWKIVDMMIIDGFPNGAAATVLRFGKIVSFLQTGYVYHYAFAMVAGMLALVTLVIYGIY